MKAGSLFDLPVHDINILHPTAKANEGGTIPVYVRLPHGATKSDQCPTVILLCGLDGHRPDFTGLLEELTIRRGWATIVDQGLQTALLTAGPYST